MWRRTETRSHENLKEISKKFGKSWWNQKEILAHK